MPQQLDESVMETECLATKFQGSICLLSAGYNVKLIKDTFLEIRRFERLAGQIAVLSSARNAEKNL